KARAHLADGAAVVLAEIGDRLVIGNETAGQPHHLDVASSLTLEPAARLNPIEIAVDVELQQDRRMIRRPDGCLRVRLEMVAMPSSPCEPAGEELNAGDHDPSGCAGDGRLEVLGKASVPIEPREGSLDHPAPRLRLEGSDALGPGDDLDGP